MVGMVECGSTMGIFIDRVCGFMELDKKKKRELKKILIQHSASERKALLWIIDNMEDFNTILTKEKLDPEYLDKLAKRFCDEGSSEAAIIVSYKMAIDEMNSKNGE